MIEMGEKIAWGSDSEIMREAADCIEQRASASVQPVHWTYCPECGEQEYQRAYGGSPGERVCLGCGQSWFPDVNYINTVRANLAERHTKQGAEQPVENIHHGDLIVGAFYWVRITFDPDTDNEWENDDMPARYAGNGKWNYLDDESDWPVRWVGPRIELATSERQVEQPVGCREDAEKRREEFEHWCRHEANFPVSLERGGGDGAGPYKHGVANVAWAVWNARPKMRKAVTLWQPIDTAPKDGTWILLSEGGVVYSGYWCKATEEWRDYGDIGCNGCTEIEPTDWAPLPKPPEQSRRG